MPPTRTGVFVHCQAKNSRLSTERLGCLLPASVPRNASHRWHLVCGRSPGPLCATNGDGDGSGAPRAGLFVEAVGKDRLHASIRVGTKVQCPATRRLDAFGAVAIGEADAAERGAEALLGMGP